MLTIINVAENVMSTAISINGQMYPIGISANPSEWVQASEWQLLYAQFTCHIKINDHSESMFN